MAPPLRLFVVPTIGQANLEQRVCLVLQNVEEVARRRVNEAIGQAEGWRHGGVSEFFNDKDELVWYTQPPVGCMGCVGVLSVVRLAAQYLLPTAALLRCSFARKPCGQRSGFKIACERRSQTATGGTIALSRRPSHRASVAMAVRSMYAAGAGSADTQGPDVPYSRGPASKKEPSYADCGGK